MAAITLTNEMALGAAALAGQGEYIEVMLPVKGRSRYCSIQGCDETGAVVTLRTSKTKGSQTYWATADVPVSDVLIPEYTAKRCLQAWYRSQERPGAKVGRLANRSVEEINVALWLAQHNQPRREPDGRFASSLVEPAGRR